jgi:hypothetical protein
MPDDFATNPRYAGLRARQQRNRDKASGKKPVAPAKKAVAKPAPKAVAKPVAKPAAKPAAKPVAKPASQARPVTYVKTVVPAKTPAPVKPVNPAPKAPEPVYHQPTTPETKVVVEKPIYVPEPSVKPVEESKPVEQPQPVEQPKPVEEPKPTPAAAPVAAEATPVAPAAQPAAVAPQAVAAPTPVSSQTPSETQAPEQKPLPQEPDVGMLPPQGETKTDYRINHKRAGLIVIASFLILLGLGGVYFSFRLAGWLSNVAFIATAEGWLGSITITDYFREMMGYMGLACGASGVLAIFELVMVAIHGKKEHGKLVLASVGAWLSLLTLMADLGWSGWIIGTNLDALKSDVTSYQYFLKYDFIPMGLYLIAVVLVIIFLVKVARCSKDAKRIERGTPSPKTEASGAKDAPLEANANVEKIVGARSYFDGKPLQVVGIKLLVFFLSLISLTLAFPWLYCYESKWRCSHTVVEGYRLGFNGKGKELFWKWLSYLGLGLVTVLIYWLWVPSKLRRFQTAHTYLLRDPKGV